MGFTNSSLVAYTKLSPNHSGQRTQAIDRISPHCVVGQCTAEGLGDWFAKTSTQASSNYGIDKDGRVGMYVEEKNRSWCTSSNANDQRAVTIECASDKTDPYAMNSKVYSSLINLCVDICRRNGKKKLLWFADKDKSLNYKPAADEMVITVHRWFANKSCPGNWLYSRLGDVASKVTAALGSSAQKPTETKGLQYYRVRKSWGDAKSQLGAYKVLANAKAKADENPGYFVFDENGKAIYPEQKKTFEPYFVRVAVSDLNIRRGPGTNYDRFAYTGKGAFTIVEEADGPGASKWGLLKSYKAGRNGWISLDFTSRV